MFVATPLLECWSSAKRAAKAAAAAEQSFSFFFYDFC